VALGTFNYRDTGLGYGDLGSLLMCLGLPYDSDEGRAVAGVVTALMHAQAHLTSAKLAERLGAYPRFWANKEPALRCVRNHIAALDPTVPFEKLTTKPPVLDLRALTAAVGSQGGFMYQTALDLFHQSYEIAQEHGYRNAEKTLLAPTGTIGFIMELDTTGVEPVLWLKMFKTLAGGGTMVVESKNVARGLRKLGYPADEAAAIAKALADGKAVRLDPKHEKVFDTSFPNPLTGRSIAWDAHVKMMAAVQPFLSGAISKTINMPREATVEDIAAAYRLGNDLNLKSLTVYRDGCKLSQPMNVPGVTDAAAKRQSPWIDPESRMKLGFERRPGVDVAVQFGQGNLYLRTSCYPDGRVGEIWATYTGMQGTAQDVLNQAMKLANVSLQHGMPMEAVVATLADSVFEPKGQVYGHPYIKYASSLTNLIARLLDYHALGNTDMLTVKPEAAADEARVADRASAVDAEAYGRRADLRHKMTGEQCPNCGSELVVPNGANCKKCLECKYAPGCG
jgi:ribonucleoside-diphosphate reductase alpha chain